MAATHWGQGFATEAARGALCIGFERLGLPEIVSFTSLGNIRSRAVMERLGMRPAQETFEHPAIPAGSALRQHCLYRLSRDQWLALPLNNAIDTDNEGGPCRLALTVVRGEH